MNSKKLVIEFVVVFTIILVVPVLVTLLWNIIGHGESIINWGISFLFAFLFSILLTWRKWQGMKVK